MMLRRKKLRQDEGFDRVQREVLLAVKVSEEEIEAAATSPRSSRTFEPREPATISASFALATR